MRIFFAAFCSIFVVILLVLFSHLNYSDQDTVKSVLPAWIQAFGSIAAIIASSLIATNQIKHEKKIESFKSSQEELSRLRIIKALIVRALGLTQEIRIALEKGEESDFMQVSPSTMRNTFQAMDKLALFDIPHGLIALDIITIGPAMNDLADLWDRCMEESSKNANQRPNATSMQELDSASKEVLMVCKEAFELANEQIAIVEKILSN